MNASGLFAVVSVLLFNQETSGVLIDRTLSIPFGSIILIIAVIFVLTEKK
ncbi:MAG: hypothetical protein ACFFD1_15365 [Candidatus Thorarchaeota archaeon]